jgi:hypothetical protein
MGDSPPNISANKLGEYMTASSLRRRRILIQQKWPPDYITTRYRESQQLIQQYSTDPTLGVGWLRARAKEIAARVAAKEYVKRTNVLNAAALNGYADFMSSMNDPKFKALSFTLGSHQSTRLPIAGVAVSVRPELVAACDLPKDGGAVVGGIKLHFPKTNPLSNDAGAYVGTLLAQYADKHLKGVADYRACAVIDVPQKKILWAPKPTKLRINALEAACSEIASVWPSIQKPSGHDADDEEPF